MSLTFGTFCSGIGAPEQAWGSLGWRARWCSEVAPFPSAVLAHRFPGVPNLGDMTKIKGESLERVDVVCAGTPCQSFSVAGLRKGMADPRGNLALVFLGLVDKLRPRWVVWENVPGVLSSGGGRDFGSFLGALGQLGYGWSYRVLDAQYVRVESHPYAVPQVRRRVFVVGYLGDWRRAAAVLLEREGLQGNPPPRREAGQGFTHPTADCLRASGVGTDRAGSTRGQDPVVAVAGCLTGAGGNSAGSATSQDAYSGLLLPVAHTLKGEGFDASEDGTGRGTPLVPVAFNPQAGGTQTTLGFDPQSGVAGTLAANQVPAVAYYDQFNMRVWGDVAGTMSGVGAGNRGPAVVTTFDPTQVTSKANRSQPRPGLCHTLPAHGHPPVAYAIQERAISTNPENGPQGKGFKSDTSYTLEAREKVQYVAYQGVRRLTPRECERLQGMPDDWTLVPWRKGMAPDGPRYKAIGNSMAVPVLSWIGQRIEMVERAVRDSELAAAGAPERAYHAATIGGAA